MLAQRQGAACCGAGRVWARGRMQRVPAVDDVSPWLCAWRSSSENSMPDTAQWPGHTGWSQRRTDGWLPSSHLRLLVACGCIAAHVRAWRAAERSMLDLVSTLKYHCCLFLWGRVQAGYQQLIRSVGFVVRSSGEHGHSTDAGQADTDVQFPCTGKAMWRVEAFWMACLSWCWCPLRVNNVGVVGLSVRQPSFDLAWPVMLGQVV